jgi:hypothetical protein
MDMDREEVIDLYEAAYLIIAGCRVEEVSCFPVANTLSCRFYFSGEQAIKARDEYFSGKACVNLMAFRHAYNQANSYIHQAKKSYDGERRATRREGGGV